MCAQSNQRFTFFNSTNPGNFKEDDTKKRIRSVAASIGWDKRLKRSPVATEEDAVEPEEQIAPGPSSTNKSTAIPPKGRPNAARQPPRHPRVVQPEIGTDENLRNALFDDCFESITSSMLRSKQVVAAEGVQEHSRLPRTSVDRVQANMGRNHLSQHHMKSSSLAVKAQSKIAKVKKKQRPPRTYDLAVLFETSGPELLGRNNIDPFNSLPVPTEPWYGWVLHHMFTVFAPRGWPSLGLTAMQGKSWERFITLHAQQEPALFYVRLLFASGDLVTLGILKPEVSLWLRTRAVRAINDALNDPTRAISDALILAVGRIAFHESNFGDRIAANAIHRPAQYRMIQMRGGMDALPFPEIGKRLMRLSDRVMSMQSGTPCYLAEDETQNYSVDQSITVLEKWVPHEGMALRQKMSPRGHGDDQQWI